MIVPLVLIKFTKIVIGTNKKLRLVNRTNMDLKMYLVIILFHQRIVSAKK